MKFRGIEGRKVSWSVLTSSADNKVLFHKDTTGLVIDSSWNDGTCHCLIIEKNGQVRTLPADKLIVLGEVSELNLPQTKQTP